MKTLRYNLFLFLVLLVPIIAFGQADTLIPSGSGQSLSDIIAADTAGIGAYGWQHGTRVYVLQKNGNYSWLDPLSIAQGRILKMRAEYETIGEDPFIWIDNNLQFRCRCGGYLAYMMGGTIDLKHIVISGYNEEQIGDLDGLLSTIIEVPTASWPNGSNIYIDSCILKSTNGNHVRTDGRATTIRITNSIFADMGFNGISNFGAGKAIDLRNNSIDTLYVCNNTFVNFQDRIVRHLNAYDPIMNLWFNNNTMVNGMSYHGMLSLGKVDSTGLGVLQIKNNLLIDNFAIGNDTADVRMYEFWDGAETDSTYGPPHWRMTWVIANPNTAANWDIANNYYSVSDSVASIFNQLAFYQNEGPALTWGINARLAALGKDTLSTFRKVAIQPVNIPDVMSKTIRWYYRPREEGGAGKGKGGNLDPNFTKEGPGIWTYDYNRKGYKYYTDTLNCNFTAEVNLAGIGDPRWHQVAGLPTGTDIQLAQGWSLVSVPRIQLDDNADVIFPGKFGDLYAFNTTTHMYEPTATAANGIGYWINYPNATSITNCGVATSKKVTFSIDEAGWVLIGSRAWPVEVSSIELTNGAVISGDIAYTFVPGAGYVPISQINPGQGAWVYVTASCTITIP